MVGRRAAGAVLVGVALAGCGPATGAPNSAPGPRTDDESCYDVTDYEAGG